MTKRLCVLIGLGIFALAGCEDDPEPPKDSATMRIVSAPAELLANFDEWYTYAVQISGEGVAIDSIWCEVFYPLGDPHSGFALLDDGSDGSLWGPDYARSPSQDIVPNDGRFTRQINGQMLADGQTGEYSFRFTAYGESGDLQPQTVSVSIEDVTPCVIGSITPFHELPACFSAFPIDVRVRPDRPDAVDSVRLVLMQGSETLARLPLNAVSADTQWQATLDPSFFGCASSAPDYAIQYEAFTRYGLACTDSFQGVEFENHPAAVTQPLFPDTILRPTELGVLDTHDVYVRLDDCELLGEQFYYGAFYEVRREDRTEWTQSPDSFFFRDDGLLHDQTAGDGLLTASLTIDRRDDLPNFLYYFKMYAVECTQPRDTSDYILDSIRVIQPGVLIAPPPGEAIGITAGVLR